VDRSRLEAFSDGVFAVAITLLALNLTVTGSTFSNDTASGSGDSDNGLEINANGSTAATTIRASAASHRQASTLSPPYRLTATVSGEAKVKPFIVTPGARLRCRTSRSA